MPPVCTWACDSEELTTRFERDYFDVVYARNTLDHSYEPIAAMRGDGGSRPGARREAVP